MKYRGSILYQGPSLIDGAEIVVIATFESANPKTGPMVQTWILLVGIDPVAAIRAGMDRAVCGNCSLRHAPHIKGACYVREHEAPLSVWRSFKKGHYPAFDSAIDGDRIARSKLRLGAYGDPAAVPYEVWAPLVKLARGHTGYTHQAFENWFDRRFLDICMVSADTHGIARRGREMGARYFRIASDIELAPDEMECPNRTTGTTCIECMECTGAGDRPHVVNLVHGSRRGRFGNNARSR